MNTLFRRPLCLTFAFCNTKEWAACRPGGENEEDGEVTHDR